ncbi:unnamed protein product [Mytilus coruscus]|uniref:DUF6589 domain-containing protein n=1 Tax=Mytilus coruscus TaxID=42192 RepID=A0A6J8B067_MYTCO|nr:unnamed protein product [Mytilus coruscus]
MSNMVSCVQGSIHQASRYSYGQGFQCTIVAAVAILAFYNVQFNGPSSWTSTTIDEIIEISNLYNRISFPENPRYLQHSEVPNDVRMLCRQFNILVHDDLFLGVVGHTGDQQSLSIEISTALRTAFDISDSNLFTSSVLTISIFRCDDNYYLSCLFDSHARDNQGFPFSDGVAILLTFSNQIELILYVSSIYNGAEFNLSPVFDSTPLTSPLEHNGSISCKKSVYTDKQDSNNMAHLSTNMFSVLANLDKTSSRKKHNKKQDTAMQSNKGLQEESVSKQCKNDEILPLQKVHIHVFGKSFTFISKKIQVKVKELKQFIEKVSGIKQNMQYLQTRAGTCLSTSDVIKCTDNDILKLYQPGLGGVEKAQYIGQQQHDKKVECVSPREYVSLILKQAVSGTLDIDIPDINKLALTELIKFVCTELMQNKALLLSEMVYKFQEFGDDAKLVDIVKKSCPPDLWEFITSLTSSNKFKSAAEVDKTFENIDFKLINILFSLLFKFDTKCNTFQLIISDIIDKFTTSSSDCINILSKFGICVSKQTLERNQTMVVENRSSYAAVKSTDVHRGFDGTSVQLVEPKPQSISLNPDERLVLPGETFKYGNTDYTCINHKTSQKVTSFFQSVVISSNLNLLNAPRESSGKCCDEIKDSLETDFTQNVIHECFTAVLNDSQFLEEKRFSQMTDYNIDEHVNHELYLYDLNRVVNYLDMTALVYVTGSAVNIFEEHDNSIKPIVQLRANPDSNHSINLLNKNGLYFPLISRQDYFDGVLFQESIDIKDTITMRSINNFNQKLSSIVDIYSSLNSGQTSVKYRRRTTKLPHYAIHNSKICTDLVDDMITDSAACLSKNVQKVSFDLIDFESSVRKRGCRFYTLHQDFKIGRELKHLVVVGDGKTYDLLVKLKLELKDDLSWLLPFPGDWHILKNYQRMIMKLYLDAGLKELIELFHHGAVGASVMQATNFDKTHHFLMQVWEAFYLQQISAILKYAEENDLNDQSEENYIKKVSFILQNQELNLKSFPKSTIEHFEEGGWVVNILGRNMHSQGLDEAHESCINREVKNAMSIFFTLSALTKYENGQLKHAFNSKVVLTDIQRSDLLNLQKIAQEHLGKYIKICQSDGIFRYNKTRKIATFSTKTHSISKVKRELKDQRTENSLLRKQIAWSQEQNTPISDLQQFISLPRAIVDHDGLPYKGDKSKTLGIYHSRYPEAFENKLHFKPDCVIIDGMFILNSKPLKSSNRLFAHFLVSLFNRWIIPYIQLNTKEIHIVFDDQSPQLSPKDIERVEEMKKSRNNS